MWKSAEYAAAGRGHRIAGMPCQDKVCTYRNGEVTVVSLADGAGSSKLSHFGAEAVLDRVSRDLGENFDEYFSEPDASVVRGKLLSDVSSALEETREKIGCERNDLSSTLLVAAVSGSRYFIVHIGDGVIGYLKDDEIRVATGPEKGDYANETFFTTSPAVRSHMRVMKGDDNQIQGFVMMSDGTADALYSRRTGTLSQGLRRIMQMTVLCTKSSMEKLLGETFESSVMKLTQDDCSICVLADTGRLPDYHSMPVSEKLDLLQISGRGRNRRKRIQYAEMILRAASGGATKEQIARRIRVSQKYIRRKMELLMALGLLERRGCGRYYSAVNEACTDRRTGSDGRMKEWKSGNHCDNSREELKMKDSHRKNSTEVMKMKEEGMRKAMNVKEEGMRKAMNMKEEGMMERMMKTGMITAGTLAATSMMFGMSAVQVHAEEVSADVQEAVVQNEDMAAPANAETAQKAVETAQAAAATADAAVQEAQTQVSEEQASVQKASDAADTARSEANQAFDTAKSQAAEEDAAAQNAVDTAESTVEAAQGRTQQAEGDVASAQDSLQKAESSVQQAVSASTVTEDDIARKESELTDAQNSLSDAETTVADAEDARDTAAEQAGRKESERQEAADAVTEAGKDKAKADEDVSVAKGAAEQAGKVLQTAEGLKDGSLDIKDTDQYKEQQEAKKAMDEASVKAGMASQDMDKASENLADAEAAVDAARKERDSAAENLNMQETAVSGAEEAKETADQAKAKAQEDYDRAATDAAAADAAVSEAQDTVTDAETGVKNAEEAKTSAENAVAAASAAVDAATQNAEAAANADIDAAQTEVSAKQEIVETAQKTLQAAAEKYKQGTLGLINWMLEKTGLMKDQIQDLQYARKVLESAAGEDFSDLTDKDTGMPEERGGKVVVVGDEKDATNLDNLLRSIEIMKKINELRASDDNYTGDLKRNDAYTNFYFMATAEAGAMRGAGLMGHSRLTTSCEDLAFGYYDPTAGWYTEEKAEFDRIKGELGIAKVTSMDDVQKVEEEADRQNVVVGHYTNLFWAANQVMGVGYTRYRRTSCYNASDASYYTDDRYNTAMHLYTVNDFEQLVKSYYQTVDKASCEEKLKAAIEEHSAAEKSLKTLQNSKESRVEEATQEARAELASRQEDEGKAAQRLKAAEEVLDAAKKVLQDAGVKKISAGQILQDAKSVLDQAAERSRTADTNLAYAVSSRDTARQKKADAENALKDAADGKTSAEAALGEKKTVLSNAQAVFEQLADAYTAATQRLNELTSEETIASLKEKKGAADTALQAALDKQSQKEDTLEKAHIALKRAEAEALEAADALKAMEAQLADAVLTRNAAKEKAAVAEEALSALRDQYAPVQHALDVRDAARGTLDIAESALKDAREELASAQAKLTQAQQTKADTGDRLQRASGLSLEEALKADIEEPDFAWLNEYVSAVKTADQELADASVNLETAMFRLDSRKADSDKAKKAYIEALADLVMAQNRVGTLQVKQGQETGTSQYAGKTAGQKAAVQTKGGKTAAAMEMKTRTKAAAGSDNKNGTTVWTAPTEPVATGDNTNLMGLLVKLFASIGVFAAVWKARKGVDEKKKPSGQKG